MHGQADGPGLVKNGTGDGLADPPGGIGGELVSLFIIKTENRPHKTKIAFLDQIGQGQSLVHVAFGNGNHQPEVGPDHRVLGALDGPVIGLDLGVQLEQLTTFRILAVGHQNTVPHVIELLLFGFQGRVTPLPEIDALHQHGDFLHPRGIFTNGFNYGIKTTANSLGIPGLILRGKQIKLAHLPQIGGGGFFRFMFLTDGQHIDGGFFFRILFACPIFARQGFFLARCFLGDNFNVVVTQKIKNFFNIIGIFNLGRQQFVEMLKGYATLAPTSLEKVIFDTLQHLPSSSTRFHGTPSAACPLHNTRNRVKFSNMTDK